MDISLTLRNIVIVGKFNPAKFDKYFFVKNNIFQENQIIEDSIFSTEFCSIISDDVNLFITPNQIIVEENTPGKMTNIDHFMIKMIDSLSNYSASAIGVNIHWFIFSEEKTRELSKKYFYNDKSNLVSEFFNTEDTSYGYYVSKDFGNSRLKLDIKPASVKKVGTDDENRILMFSFNFHIDMTDEDCKSKTLMIMNELKEYINETKKIMSIYEN